MGQIAHNVEGTIALILAYYAAEYIHFDCVIALAIRAWDRVPQLQARSQILLLLVSGCNASVPRHSPSDGYEPHIGCMLLVFRTWQGFG